MEAYSKQREGDLFSNFLLLEVEEAPSLYVTGGEMTGGDLV